MRSQKARLRIQSKRSGYLRAEQGNMVQMSDRLTRVSLRHGCEVVERGTHRIADGLDMDCVRMRKQLAGS